MLVEVSKDHPEVGFAFVDQGGTAGQIRSFLNAEKLAPPNLLLDPKLALGRHFEALGLPTTLFFNRDGTLAYRHVGEISRAEVSRQIEALE